MSGVRLRPQVSARYLPLFTCQPSPSRQPHPLTHGGAAEVVARLLHSLECFPDVVQVVVTQHRRQGLHSIRLGHEGGPPEQKQPAPHLHRAGVAPRRRQRAAGYPPAAEHVTSHYPTMKGLSPLWDVSQRYHCNCRRQPFDNSAFFRGCSPVRHNKVPKKSKWMFQASVTRCCVKTMHTCRRQEIFTGRLRTRLLCYLNK